MNINDAKGVGNLFIFSRNIKSLVGIDAFADLKQLICAENKLTNLDISKNVGLKEFDCSFNSNLKTICVADVAKANANTNWEKDPTATYEVCK